MAAAGKAHPKYNVDHWGVDHGLMHENVGAVTQTRDGYLWIGSDGGLARFDGVKFLAHRCKSTPGLVGDTVRALFEDSKGVLWVGTNRGLSRYSDGKFEAAIEMPTTHAVFDVCEDGDGNVWIATQNSLVKYRNGTYTTITAPALPEGRGITSVFVDSQKRLWIGVVDYPGVVCYQNGKFEQVEHSGAIGSFVTSIGESPKGTMWFGTNGAGLVRQRENRFVRFDSEHGLAGRYVTELYTDPTGSLWIAALGLQRFSEETSSFETVATNATPSIRHVWSDHEGSVWAATYGDGLLRVRPARYKILNAESGLPGDLVRTVMQDTMGAIWLAQGGFGAVKVAGDGTTTRLLPPDHEIQGDEALSTFTTRSGHTFFGSQRALYLWHEGKLTSHVEYRRSRAFFEDSKSKVWIGTFESGLVYWKDGEFTRLPLPAALAKATACLFAEDSDGTIYVGTMSHGVLRLKEDGVDIYNTSNVLPSDEARALFVDADRNLWVGTKRGPAIRIDGKWHSHAWMSEMIDQYVTGIVNIPDDYLLINTSRGVMRFHRKEVIDAVRNGVRPERLRQVVIAEAARTGNIGAACFPGTWTAKSGEVWIAARKGAVVIDPQKIRQDTHLPPIKIEQLNADGTNRLGGSAVKLNAGTRQLTIEYSALTFVQPNRVFFKYQLSGYEDEWIDAGTRRVAFYNNLPPGTYAFRVKACNSDGVWNETGASVAFTVLPFFYQTWWFRFAFLAGLLGTSVGFFRWRVRRFQRHAKELEQQNAELERRIAERTAELAKSFAALKVSENFYHSLVESLPQIIVRKDVDSRFTYANSAFAELVEKTLPEIIGKIDADVYPAERAAKNREEDVRIMATGKAAEYENIVEKNGRKRYLHVKKVPIYAERNQPIGVQVLFWDVTVFRETEEKLKEAQSELIETSRLAGMAEIATGVLHNIGNALNSVNISATSATERIAALKVPSLAKAAQLIVDQKERIAEFFATDPRGQQLPSFLTQLSESLQSGREGAMSELSALRTGVEHIKEIVAAQQSYAHVSGLTEMVPVDELVESALRIAEASLVRHHVTITRHFAPVPPIRIQRQKALQILVNLVNNAKDSMSECGRTDPQLNLKIVPSDAGGVQIEVKDNGVGIAKENLTRIFAFGFTTKKQGHGFGLHSSALAAREMNGSLTVASEGLGQGATFTLTLPAPDPASARV